MKRPPTGSAFGPFPTAFPAGASPLSCGGLSVSFRVFLLAAVILLAFVSPSRSADGGHVAEAFRKVIRDGDPAGLKAILGPSGVLEARNDLGETPLMIAVQLGAPEAVRELLDRGADVNATNRAGATALIRGAARPEMVRLLLERGADPARATGLGHTPLMLAARSPGALECVRLLLARGVDVNAKSRHGATALMGAVAALNPEAVRLLVEAGADVNAVPMPGELGVDPIWGGIRTPLMWAAFRGDLALAKYLLDHGAQVNQVIPFGTALTHAGWRGDAAMARFLVERGGDVRLAEPFSGYTPLHWAASRESGEVELVRFLLGRGADPRAEGGQPIDAFLGVAQTPASLASLRGPNEAWRLLGGAAAPVAGGVERVRAGRNAAGPAGGVVADQAALAWAVAKAVPPLQKSAAQSRESFLRHASKQACVSCHQQYFPLAAVSDGKARGVPVDEPALKALAEVVVESHRGQPFDDEPMFHPDPAHSYGYAVLALTRAGAGASMETDALVHHLASIQNSAGNWNVNLPRPPMQSSDITATALAVHALKHYGWASRRAEFDGRIRAAKAWLDAAQPATHEERVYQLLGLYWAGVPASDLKTRADQLAGEQRADGGWAQLPGLEADAYATGQALFALREAGGYAASDPRCGRAARFLVESQGMDGTWHIRRRAFPFQPTMESGFPHGRDSWISATGTSWAVIALSTVLNPVSDDDGRAMARRLAAVAAAEPAGAGSGRLVPGEVDFVKDVQPVLERSCVPCHSGDRARGGYRLTDRNAMLTPGNLGLPPVLPGRSADSILLRYVADDVDDLEMPPRAKRDKFPALTGREMDLFRSWVEAGAVWPDGVVLGVARTASVSEP
ncbi:MAG: ankyrin repeat domain-containing protein [Limisphaerales bacterium]